MAFSVIGVFSPSGSECARRLCRFCAFQATIRWDLWPFMAICCGQATAPAMCVHRRLNNQQNEHSGSRCQGGGACCERDDEVWGEGREQSRRPLSNEWPTPVVGQLQMGPLLQDGSEASHHL